MPKFVIFESGQEKSEGQHIAINPDHVAAVHPTGRWTKKDGFKTDGSYAILLVGPAEQCYITVLHNGDLASLIYRLEHVPSQPPPPKRTPTVGNSTRIDGLVWTMMMDNRSGTDPYVEWGEDRFGHPEVPSYAAFAIEYVTGTDGHTMVTEYFTERQKADARADDLEAHSIRSTKYTRKRT